MIVGAFIFVALILLMLVALIPSRIWIACGIAVALVAIIGLKERLAGRNF
jgi:hypothetical protein